MLLALLGLGALGVVDGGGDGGLVLDADDLNVARVRLVGVDATVRTVGASSHSRCSVHGDVLDLHVLNREVLVGSARLDVLEKARQEVAALCGPATQRSARVELLSLSLAGQTSDVAAERDDALLSLDVTEVTDGLEQVLHADARQKPNV